MFTKLYLPTCDNVGMFCNEIALWTGAFQFALTGSYTLKGRIMKLELEQLQVKLFSLSLPSLDIREGRGVRIWIERLVRGGKKNTKEFEKRPNTYSWCYADDRVCVAQGSSGSVAMWIRASTVKSIDKN